MTVQYADLREKVGTGELTVDDLDDLRNTANNGVERAAVASVYAKTKAGTITPEDFEALGRVFPERKVEKRVEKAPAAPKLKNASNQSGGSMDEKPVTSE